jgi:hypothetical protein
MYCGLITMQDVSERAEPAHTWREEIRVLQGGHVVQVPQHLLLRAVIRDPGSSSSGAGVQHIRTLRRKGCTVLLAHRQRPAKQCYQYI